MPIYTIWPFVGLLLTIGIAPLIWPHFWEQNPKKAMISFLFALPIFGYFLWNGLGKDLLPAIEEYFSFIILLASLYIVAGGVLLKGDFDGTPFNNTVILCLGSVLANFIGTTGASMLLIRPILKINSQRERTAHIPIFFIFLVSNIGGSLTPLGDPPLFLGFLRGVPFFWTLNLFWIWLSCLSLLLVIFYFYDSVQYKRETEAALQKDHTQVEPVDVLGKGNFLLLGGIIVGAFLHSPVRELVMITMALVSYFFSPLENRKQNGFTFHPINEVAILFAGIFVTMVPALTILKANGAAFGITKPWQFFWLTGGLLAYRRSFGFPRQRPNVSYKRFSGSRFGKI